MTKKDLADRLRKAQQQPMSAEDVELQRRSFVYGNTKVEYECLTREVVEEVANKLSDPPATHG